MSGKNAIQHRGHCRPRVETQGKEGPLIPMRPRPMFCDRRPMVKCGERGRSFPERAFSGRLSMNSPHQPLRWGDCGFARGPTRKPMSAWARSPAANHWIAIAGPWPANPYGPADRPTALSWSLRYKQVAFQPSSMLGPTAHRAGGGCVSPVRHHRSLTPQAAQGPFMAAAEAGAENGGQRRRFRASTRFQSSQQN